MYEKFFVDEKARVAKHAAEYGDYLPFGILPRFGQIILLKKEETEETPPLLRNAKHATKIFLGTQPTTTSSLIIAAV